MLSAKSLLKRNLKVKKKKRTGIQKSRLNFFGINYLIFKTLNSLPLIWGWCYFLPLPPFPYTACSNVKIWRKNLLRLYVREALHVAKHSFEA